MPPRLPHLVTTGLANSASSSILFRTLPSPWFPLKYRSPATLTHWNKTLTQLMPCLHLQNLKQQLSPTHLNGDQPRYPMTTVLTFKVLIISPHLKAHKTVEGRWCYEDVHGFPWATARCDIGRSPSLPTKGTHVRTLAKFCSSSLHTKGQQVLCL